MTCKAPLAAIDTLMPLELQTSGVSKEKLALMSTVMIPISVFAQSWVSKAYLAGEGTKPVSIFLHSYKARVVIGASLVALIHVIRAAGSAEAGFPAWVWAVGFLPLALGTAASQIMFVAQMAFFNRVSDPKIGGTYMTMLNTIANLGGQWPAPAVLALKSSLEGLSTGYDSFTLVTIPALILGAGWITVFSGTALKLQGLKIKDWHA